MVEGQGVRCGTVSMWSLGKADVLAPRWLARCSHKRTLVGVVRTNEQGRRRWQGASVGAVKNELKSISSLMPTLYQSLVNRGVFQLGYKNAVYALRPRVLVQAERTGN
jgi:hypothetical protein